MDPSTGTASILMPSSPLLHVSDGHAQDEALNGSGGDSGRGKLYDCRGNLDSGLLCIGLISLGLVSCGLVGSVLAGGSLLGGSLLSSVLLGGTGSSSALTGISAAAAYVLGCPPLVLTLSFPGVTGQTLSLVRVLAARVLAALPDVMIAAALQVMIC